MIILDTNVISELMKPFPDPQVRNWLVSLGNQALSTTAVTLTELQFGLQRLPAGQRQQELYAKFETLMQSLPVLPFDEVAAHEAARLRAIPQAAGQPSQPSDMMIAGIAAALDSPLATRNTKDFSGLPITLINPWQFRAPEVSDQGGI